MTFCKYASSLLFVLLVAWMLVSWVDVINHNDPFEADGNPAGWNAFVVLTEATK